MQIVTNGRRNVRHRDGRPLAIAVTENLRESGVPLVRTYQYATHCARARSSLLSRPDQVSRRSWCIAQFFSCADLVCVQARSAAHPLPLAGATPDHLAPQSLLSWHQHKCTGAGGKERM